MEKTAYLSFGTIWSVFNYSLFTMFGMFHRQVETMCHLNLIFLIIKLNTLGFSTQVKLQENVLKAKT